MSAVIWVLVRVASAALGMADKTPGVMTEICPLVKPAVCAAVNPATALVDSEAISAVLSVPI